RRDGVNTSTTDVTVSVECEGRVASWTPQTGFTGDSTLVAHAVEAATGHYAVEWGGLEPQTASTATLLGALSALMYFRPGRTRIVAWPEELRSWWESHRDECGAP